jgi:hypothetical protein
MLSILLAETLMDSDTGISIIVPAHDEGPRTWERAARARDARAHEAG